jgi:glycosyltransferase involved in cell wall biosynthesis
MKSERLDSSVEKAQILFLFPLVYRPLKINVAKRFGLLSHWYKGHIFSLSGERQRNVPVADFFFHSEKFGSGSAKRALLGMWVQIIVPLRFLWGRSRVSAVLAYDPYRSGLAALILKYLLRTKMIVELNGDYHRVRPRRTDVSKVLMRGLFNLVLGRADAVKVVNADQESFCRTLLPRKPIYRFPDFAATEYFESLESYQGDYLLSVGQPFDLKGMDVLIAAFKRIAEKHPRMSLRIMGYCPRGELVKYKELADGHPRIAFVDAGWIEDVAEQMRGCFALVNAARSDAMPRVHLEAMACAKPIVATRTNGALEGIVDGQTGLLCDIGDVEDLSAKLDELLASPDRAAKLGQAGRMRMQRMFSERAYVEAFRSMLEEVTGTAQSKVDI